MPFTKIPCLEYPSGATWPSAASMAKYTVFAEAQEQNAKAEATKNRPETIAKAAQEVRKQLRMLSDRLHSSHIEYCQQVH